MNKMKDLKKQIETDDVRLTVEQSFGHGCSASMQTIYDKGKRAHLFQNHDFIRAGGDQTPQRSHGMWQFLWSVRWSLRIFTISGPCQISASGISFILPGDSMVL